MFVLAAGAWAKRTSRRAQAGERVRPGTVTRRRQKETYALGKKECQQARKEHQRPQPFGQSVPSTPLNRNQSCFQTLLPTGSGSIVFRKDN